MPLGDYKPGDQGPSIAMLQTYLADVGLSVRRDGTYGVETAAAVKAFQAARRIRVDGIAGPETLIELAKARGEGWRMSGAPAPSGVAAPGQSPAPTTNGSPASHPVKPWMVLGALIFFVWWANRSKDRGSDRGGRLSVDDFEEIVEQDEPPGDDGGEETDEDESEE